MRRIPSMRAAKGLTLIELAVVIALLVTLATLAIPSFADQLARHRARAAGEALLAELRETRYDAAQRQQTMHVSFAAGADWCWAVTQSAGCDCRVPQSCRVKAVGAAHFKGVELIAGDDARFEPAGTGSGHAELRSSRGHVLRVEVSPLGRSRLCAPGVAVAGVAGC